MKLIIGLGNPGIRYTGTRHNAGRLLVEFLAKSEGLKWRREKALQASVAKTLWGSEEVMLARPEVFMNLSGEPVSLLMRRTRVDASQDLLIVVDDVALPFGKWRLRGKGSDGGHNGLKSITLLLGSSVYPRLRMGIAPAESAEKIQDMAGYVLESFESREKTALSQVLEKGGEACRVWASKPMAAAMNIVNP